MINDLQFVKGAVAKKDFVPALTHFHICNGRILGFNGALALCSPIALNIDCSPKAIPFVKAIQTCKEVVELHLTPQGRLSVRSGRFSAFVPCIEEAFPGIGPEGPDVKLEGSLLEALRVLSPFIGVDASRPWARGVLFRGASACATNNIIAVEYWLGHQFPVDLNVPEEVVDELLRIGTEPTKLQVTENSATFHFGGERWMRSQLLTTKWPELDGILGKASSPSPLPPGFFSALTDLLPFANDLERVYFHDDKVSTEPNDGDGAAVEIPGIKAGPCFNIRQLLKLEGFVETIDFSLYPNPCLFFGPKARGAIVGMTR